jgi:hypothetical protein
MRTTFARTLGTFAIACWLGACSSGGNGGNTGGAGSQGSAGNNSQGAAGNNSQGAAGNNSQGAAGNNSQGAAGNTQGAAGQTGAAGSAQGAAGQTGAAGMTGAAGQTGAAGMTGVGGTTGNAGAGGSASGGAIGTGGATAGPVVMSPGCGKAPAGTDSSTKFVQKIINITGVDMNFITMYPPNGGDQFSWTKRNYYVRLPANYDQNKAYPVDMEGTGCGGGETTGSSGEYALPNVPGQDQAIQIGLSYVTSQKANPSCPAFTDDYVNSPEVQYIDQTVTEILANYCVDVHRVFMNGYSSGAFESAMVALANPDKVRAVGLQIGGGFRKNHPPIMNKPIAAMYVVGMLDQGNPIGPLATPQNDTIGSVASRDELLKRNGCVAQDFQIVDTCSAEAGLPCVAGVANGDTYSNVPNAVWDPMYPKCHVYTGCPPKYPVVWCPLEVNHGNGPNPMGSDGGMTVENYRRVGMWKFFSGLLDP